MVHSSARIVVHQKLFLFLLEALTGVKEDLLVVSKGQQPIEVIKESRKSA